MPKKRHKPEEIIRKLRQAEVERSMASTSSSASQLDAEPVFCVEFVGDPVTESNPPAA